MDELEDALTGTLLAAFQGDVDSCLRAVEEIQGSGGGAETSLDALARLSSRLMALAVRKEAPDEETQAALWVAAQYVGASFASRCSTSFRDAVSRARQGVPAALELESTILQLAVRRAVGAGSGGDEAAEACEPEFNPTSPDVTLQSARRQQAVRHPTSMPPHLPKQGEGGELEKRIHEVWPAVVDHLSKVKGKLWLGGMLAESWCVMSVEPNSVLRLSVPVKWMERIETEARASDVLTHAFVKALDERIWIKLEPRRPGMVNPPGTITGASLTPKTQRG